VKRLVIGLAGGVGAGKSTVAAILAQLGCVVADADALAREALRQPDIRDEIAGWWGRGVLDAAGEIDRKAVARIVFERPEERRRLESLVHPWIRRRQQAIFAAAPREARALVIDAPLLFETGLDRACDAVIFVDAPRAARIARLGATRGWTEAELDRREASQLPLDEKRSRADHVVVNDGDLDGLADRVRRILDELIARGRGHGKGPR
jgi:dephospho-CoA kinase